MKLIQKTYLDLIEIILNIRSILDDDYLDKVLDIEQKLILSDDNSYNNLLEIKDYKNIIGNIDIDMCRFNGTISLSNKIIKLKEDVKITIDILDKLINHELAIIEKKNNEEKEDYVFV